jgi:hypothetical protein
MAGNPIQRLLDDRRFPWRASHAELIARHGERPDPWFNRARIVLVDETPPVPGLLRPLHFEPAARDDPAMPPLLLWGWAWARRKPWLRSRAMASLKLVRDSLEPALGPPEPRDASNTRGWSWRSGPAWIETFSFPPFLALPPLPGAIPDRRDPKVDESCWIRIFTGYRPLCTAAERAAIEAFEPWLTLREGGDPAWIVEASPVQETLEYVREPFPGFERTIGRLGRTPDGGTLIFGSSQLHVVPAADVDHVFVDRVMPGRGGGHAAMSLACRGAFGDRPLRRVFLAGHAEADGLNDMAKRVADWLGRPCVLGEYGIDD